MILKEKIVYEGLKLFSLKGFLNTSMSDILEAANTSKGGFYNHFKSKEELFFAVLEKAGTIWRERNLEGLDKIESPVGKLGKLLENYCNRYLKDSVNFPGGCVFITLIRRIERSATSPIQGGRQKHERFEKHDQPFSACQAKENWRVGERPSILQDATEMLFHSMLGTSIGFGATKSTEKPGQKQ